MSETPPYFYNPFGVSADDLSPIPVTGSGSPTDAVNYQYGFSDCYEYNLLTNPAARPMARGVMNQVLFDITTLLQQYSQYGVPFFITTAQNQGTPFPYPIYARVNYGGVVYENQVNLNTATPGTDNSWLVISGDATGVLTGTILDFAGTTVPAGYLSCDGSAVSRTTYAALLAVISQTQTATTTVSLNTITLSGSTSQLFVGMKIECANFPSGTQITQLTPTITVNNSATASGSVSMQFFNWGNGDGSTTFNVPDLRRNVTIGQGGTPVNPDSSVGGVPGIVVGQDGGQECHVQTVNELASHTHSDTGYDTLNVGNAGPKPIAMVGTSYTLVTDATGGSYAANVMQPSTIVYKIIKT